MDIGLRLTFILGHPVCLADDTLWWQMAVWSRRRRRWRSTPRFCRHRIHNSGDRCPHWWHILISTARHPGIRDKSL